MCRTTRRSCRWNCPARTISQRRARDARLDSCVGARDMDAERPARRMLDAAVGSDLNRWLAAQGVTIERLCADSRRCAPGVAFLAYPGESADGRRYIDDALARGSSAVFWEAEGFRWNDAWRVPNLGVRNLKAAAGSLAHEFYGKPSESLWTCGVT